LKISMFGRAVFGRTVFGKALFWFHNLQSTNPIHRVFFSIVHHCCLPPCVSHCLKLTVSLQVESSADCVTELEFLLTVSQKKRQNAHRSTNPISIIAIAASLGRSSPLWPDFLFARIHTRFISSRPGCQELIVLLQAEKLC